jgi:UDP-N-acetylglucosamine 4,6-dehydratase
MFKNKVLLITGGTGSFGNAVLRRFANSELKEIRIFSRDEKKQDDMRRRYRDDRLRFYIGDVRNSRSLESAVHGADFIFHAAALKQVPSCEFYPMEAVQTNVIGTDNVMRAAVAAKVSRVVCLSTDKAVYPINAMGISKAMMEKVTSAIARTASPGTEICCTRYGNVMSSRGSVIPHFVNQIRNSEPLTVTDGKMTRFMMTLDDAVRLVLFAFENGKAGDTFVQKAPAATIDTLAQAVCTALGKPDHPVRTIGTRHGEKLFETLLSREEMAKASDLGEYYRVPIDGRDLNYDKYFEQGELSIASHADYTSHNTTQLDVAGMMALLQTMKGFDANARSGNADWEDQ